MASTDGNVSKAWQAVEEHRLQVRLWFAGLRDEDKREILRLLKQSPLVTYHALKGIVDGNPQ